jgi:hypothetical protein
MSVVMGVRDEENADAGDSGQVVCTLAEGHYFHGVAALINSLARAGFKGTVVVGYRGQLPRWLGDIERGPTSHSYTVTPAIRLQVVEVTGLWHLNNCKPHFIGRVLFELHRHAELIYYFDTDIVIKQPWEIFARWARSGVVLVLDVADSYMPPDHVYRREWQALAARQNRDCRAVTGYFNGGCVGIDRSNAEFVSVWSALMEELERDGADMGKMKNFTSKPEFSRMDQDILNATIMATQAPIALLGYETMGMFPWIGEVMPHAMWHHKPWKRNYIVDALRGYPPGRVHLAFWEFVDGPIRPFNNFELSRKRFQVALGRIIGLIHTRSYRDL